MPAMMSMNLSDIAVLNIKGSDYYCIISGSSKTEAINLNSITFNKPKLTKQLKKI